MLIMLETETLATSQNAVVLSIGAIAFSHERGIEPIKFYSKIDLKEQESRIIDPQFVAGWMRRAQENDEALEIFDGARESVCMALDRLSRYINAHLTVDGEVWSEGPDFDCAMVRSLYEEFGIGVPWRTSQQRCVRTLRNLVQQLGIEINVDPPQETMADQTLSKVEWDARFIVAAIDNLRARRHRRQLNAWI